MTRKRKKSKQSPGEEKQQSARTRRENKQRQTMDTENGQRGKADITNVQYQPPLTPQTPQAQYCNPGLGYMYPQNPNMNMNGSPYQVWGSATPVMTQSGQPTPTPNSPGPIHSDIVQMLIKRLDSMDSKLSQLDTIQASVNTVSTNMKNMDKRLKDLESKVLDIERGREFDSQTLTDVNKQHQKLDRYINRMKKFEEERANTESSLKAEIQDLKCRSMRDNLLSHKLPEEREENCEQKNLAIYSR